MGNKNLENAQVYAGILKGEIEQGDAKYYCSLITAYATLAIAEKLYEERDAPVFVSQEQCNGIVEDFLRLRKAVVGNE